MGATHHLHPNIRFLQLQSSDEKSTVRSDRKSLIKLKANRMVSLFLLYIYILGKKIAMMCFTSWLILYGAGEGNRTLLSSLGSSHSTDELRPHDVHIVSYINLFIQVQLIILYIPIVVIVLYYYQNRCIK